MANARGIRAGAAYIELFVNDSKLVRGLQNAAKKLKAFGDAITGWGQKMATIGAAVTAPLVGSAKAFSEMGDRMAKMSQRTGISVETLSELAYAAELSGADLDTLEGSLRKMQKAIVAAAEGSEGATDALAKLGLTVENLRGLSPDQQFKLIADRLSQIQSPAVRAALAMELFGKSGTQLLPLMLEGAKGIEALQRQAHDLGLTMSTEDAKAAEALNDSFDTLWKVVKQGVFVIGSALAPTLRSVSEWIIRTVVTTTDWIKQNKELVVTIFKVAAAVVAAGLALMALGYAITVLGGIISAAVTVVTTVTTAFSILASVVSWLLTPFGLVVAAIGVVLAALAALAGYLLYASGVAGQALQWLGDRFADLSDFATESFQGISDALVAGDIALAAKILWLSLKVIWQKGVLELTRLWEWLKGWTLKLVYGLWYGVQAAWEIGVSSVAEVMLKLYYAVLDIWERMSTGVMNVWDGAVNWVAKRIIDLQGLVDDSLDTDAVKKALDEDANQRINQRNREKDQNRQRIAEERAGALKMLGQEHEQNMAKIGQASIDAENQLDADAKKKVDAAQAELDAAKKEWQDAIAEAKKKRQMKESEGPNRLQAPPDVGDYLEGLGPTIEQAQKKTIGVAGTFNAMEARGLGAGGVTDRIANATEATAKNTKKLADKVRDGGLAFD